MKRLVVDSCVAVKWLVNEPGSGRATRLLDDYLAARLDLLAPDSIGLEVGNALWTRCHRGLITAEEARQGLTKFCRLQVSTVACASLLEDAMPLALTYSRSFYDCVFLALSLREDCAFVTADARLVNAVGGVFSNIELLPEDF